MSTEEPRTRVVGAAVLDAADAPTLVLAAQRAYPESLRGLWEFPGGKQEPGEIARDALLRECREELGVHLDLLAEVPAPGPHGWPLTGSAVMRVFTAVLREPSDGPSLSDAPPLAVDAATDTTTPDAHVLDAPAARAPHLSTPTLHTAASPVRALEQRVRDGQDHLDVRWLPLDDPAAILGLPWIPADLPIVAALLEMLRTEHA